MRRSKKPAGRPEPRPRPTDAERRAIYNLLFAGRATRQESRTAVRCLLRRASRNQAGQTP